MKRSGLVFLLFVLLCILAAPLAVEAQQTSKTYRIGWLHPVPLPSEWMEGFRQGLREFGYVEGKDPVIESLSLQGGRREAECACFEAYAGLGLYDQDYRH